MNAWLRKCRQKRWSITRFKLIFLHILQPSTFILLFCASRDGGRTAHRQTNRCWRTDQQRRRGRRIAKCGRIQPESRLSIWSTHSTETHKQRHTHLDTNRDTHRHTHTHTHIHTHIPPTTTRSSLSTTSLPPTPPSIHLSFSRPPPRYPCPTIPNRVPLSTSTRKTPARKNLGSPKKRANKHVNCFCSVWARTVLFLLGVETLRLFGYSDCFGTSLSYLGCSGVLNLFSMFRQIWWLPRFTCF